MIHNKQKAVWLETKVTIQSNKHFSYEKIIEL